MKLVVIEITTLTPAETQMNITQILIAWGRESEVHDVLKSIVVFRSCRPRWTILVKVHPEL